MYKYEEQGFTVRPKYLFCSILHCVFGSITTLFDVHPLNCSCDVPTLLSLLDFKWPFTQCACRGALISSAASSKEREDAGRWNNNRGVAFNSVYEIGPLVYVSFTTQARRRPLVKHHHDFAKRKHFIPDVDVCQHPLKGLTSVEASSKGILFLPQNQGTSTLDSVSCLETSAAVEHFAISIELPIA